jgi:hypothetical protein
VRDAVDGDGVKVMSSVWMSRVEGLVVGGVMASALAMGAAPSWALNPNPPAATSTQAKGQAQGAAQGTARPPAGGRHISWQELVPAGWNPTEILKEKFNDPGLAVLSDDHPKVQALMEEMRKLWDTAPVNEALNGVQGRIPGYVVPLEDSRAGLKSFLLVPYYGACIHTPPPPANQIIHVVLQRPVKGFQTMDTVWVHGTLRTERQNSEMGVSGYRIDAVRVAPYERRTPEAAR